MSGPGEVSYLLLELALRSDEIEHGLIQNASLVCRCWRLSFYLFIFWPKIAGEFLLAI